MGKKFREGLEKLKEKHKIIREVRGKGLMIGIESRFDIKEIIMDGINNGLLLLYSGRNVLRLLPPLILRDYDVNSILDILDFLFTKEEKRRNV